MFIAKESIAKIKSPILQHILLNNLDSYLIGAYYPDSGYVKGAHYGEDSHWDPFIYAFADYIKEQYPHLKNPKLIAFLFGCASHRQSDEIIHAVFYHDMAENEFAGDYAKAHRYGDPGIDILLEMEHVTMDFHSNVWWIPVDDLLNVYHRMGKDNYTEQEITWGTSVIHAANTAEKKASPALYRPLFKKIPWTTSHYYDWPNGGVLMNIEKVADYQNHLWQYLNS